MYEPDSDRDLARANLYRYLCLAPLPPSDPRFGLLRDPGFRSLVVAAVDWMRADATFHPPELGPGELHPSELDPTSLLPGEEDIERSYLQVFGHSVSKDCPPYENEYYANHDVTFRSERLADIAGFYRAFGLDRSGTVRDRIDHLTFEAEFLQILIARQLYAADQGLDESHVDVCRQAQRSFFVEHLGWWLPAFGIQLESCASCDFHKGLGRFVRGFVPSERAVLDVPVFTELPVTHPDAFEPEGSCFDCSLNVDGDVAPPPGPATRRTSMP